MQVRVRRIDWEFASVFRISYRSRTHAQAVLVELVEGALCGRGEALGVSYHGESVELLLDQIASIRADLENGISRAHLQSLLPAGGARNAIDCALWDLEAKRAGLRAWELAGLQSIQPLTTAYTLGLDAPEATAQTAAALKQYPILKLKLAGVDDLERVTAVRRIRPDVDLVVDANQAWSERDLHEMVPLFGELGVKLIEQPLPVGQDDVLARFRSPVPICADESCQTSSSIPSLIGKYQYVNIKLDKTGGLTEALQVARCARDAGLRLMVGCMGGSSLSMAPAFIVGQHCDTVDLDGPLLARTDMPHGIRYVGARMHAPEAQLWG